MKPEARSPGLPLESGAAGAERQPSPEPPPEDAARFAALLRPPAAGATVLAGMAPSQPAADPSPAARLVEELAGRLLVGEGEGGGDAVHVVARDVGIPGLEVSVRREAGGLVVELLAPNPADLALLRGGAAELVARLEARFSVRAEVRVRRRQPGEQGEAG